MATPLQTARPVRVGYCVPVSPQLASFRLRVALPGQYLGCEYVIGAPGDVSFFYKNGDPKQAESLDCVVYDVVNDHFKTMPWYHEMCAIAHTITVASVAMAVTVHEHTGRDATIIDDPYENDEQRVACEGQSVLWFGHSANLSSLFQHDWDDFHLTICTNSKAAVWWTPESERECLKDCAAVVLTSNNPGASSNRVVKAIRAGRPVIVPRGIAAWEQFEPYIWIGDVREGLKWALNNREEACRRTAAGQRYVRDRFSPKTMGQQWRALFDSVLAAETSATTAGSA